MKFVNRSTNKRLDSIVNKVNEVIHGAVFKEKMLAITGFNPLYTSCPEVTGAHVWLMLTTDPSEIEVFTFKSLNPFTKSNGYTKDDGKTRMFLNTRKFNRSDASIAATIAHEGVHEVDNNDSQYFYNHGDNKPKEGTAPRIVADIVYEIISGQKSTECSAI